MKAFGSVAPPAYLSEKSSTTTTPAATMPLADGIRDRHGPPLRYASAAAVPSVAVAVAGEQLCGVRILIVDDCILYRDTLINALAAHGVLIAGVASDVHSVVAAVQSNTVEMILLNLSTRHSRALLRAAMQANPQVRVVVLGVSDDDESEVIACAEAGVVGYHTRTESIESLLMLMAKVAAGEALCSPRVSAILLRRLSMLAQNYQPATNELVLTAREAQILEMLRLGLSNRDIATQLCIAVHTVKNHVHSVLTKLGVSTRAEAAALSRSLRYGLSDS